jgi:RNase_H superfamily
VSGPNVLLWDIESAPNLAWVWSKWQTNVVAFEEDWYLLSCAWKWRGDKKAQVMGLDDLDTYAENPTTDKGLVEIARDLFDQADVVVAHNGVQFDTKKLQTRMLVHGFPPPSPFQEVDTLRIARSKFAFTSNTLNDLCQSLGFGRKLPVGGFETWQGCMEGTPEAWKRMKKYNLYDVVLLEKLYDTFFPWSPKSGTPNMATLSGTTRVCPRCGSDKGMIVRGYVYTGVSRATKTQCKACGGYSRTRLLDHMEPRYVPA